MVDAIGQTNYLLGRAHFPKQSPAKPPKLVPRPGDNGDTSDSGGDPPVTPEELAEFRKTPM